MSETDVIKVLKNHAQYTNAKVIDANTGKEYKVSEAIENLINRNKQLNYENMKLKEILEEDNYIPKSKVREKIENLKTKKEFLMDSGIDLTWKEYYEAQIDLCEELLEGDK